MSIELKIDMKTVKNIQRGLKLVSVAASNRVVKRAANFAMTPVLQEAKKRVPKRYGLLKKSMGKKQTFNKAKGIATVLVGPREGFGKVINGQLHDPARYGYMIEHGSSTYPAQSFLRSSLNDKSREAIDRFKANALAGINREVEKLKSK